MRRSIRLLSVLALTVSALSLSGPPVSAISSARHFPLVVHAEVGDLSIVELSFPGAHGHALNARSLRLAVPPPFGDYYVGLATPKRQHGSGRLALMLVANRATKVLIPSSLHLRLASARSLGPARIRRTSDPLSDPHPGPSWLCGLARDGAPPALTSLTGHGAPIAGADPAGAVVEGFDMACGLRYSAGFRAALQQGPYEEPCTLPACSAEPEPKPAPGPPGCAPCDPRPGYACPLTAVAAVCVAGKDERPPGTAY